MVYSDMVDIGSQPYLSVLWIRKATCPKALISRKLPVGADGKFILERYDCQSDIPNTGMLLKEALSGHFLARV